MVRQLGISASDALRNHKWRPPRRWEEPLVEAWGQNWFDTEQMRDQAPLADSIGARGVRLTASRVLSVCFFRIVPAAPGLGASSGRPGAFYPESPRESLPSKQVGQFPVGVGLAGCPASDIRSCSRLSLTARPQPATLPEVAQAATGSEKRARRAACRIVRHPANRYQAAEFVLRCDAESARGEIRLEKGELAEMLRLRVFQRSGSREWWAFEDGACARARASSLSCVRVRACLHTQGLKFRRCLPSLTSCIFVVRPPARMQTHDIGRAMRKPILGVGIPLFWHPASIC